MNLKIFSYKSINSTNDLAIKKIKKGFSSGIIISETQKKGRGRQGRNWISKKGNIFLSIFFKIHKLKKIQNITSDNCRIIVKIISKFIKKKITVKLPNDLLIDGSKFCGILQETYYKNQNKFLILGVGINIESSPILNNYSTTYLKKYNKRLSKFVIIKSIKKTYEGKLKNFKNLM